MYVLGSNPLPTTENSLKKQKSVYEVLTPSIKPPIQILIGLWVFSGLINFGL